MAWWNNPCWFKPHDPIKDLITETSPDGVETRRLIIRCRQCYAELSTVLASECATEIRPIVLPPIREMKAELTPWWPKIVGGRR